MAEYRIEIVRSAARELETLASTVGRRVSAAIETLAQEPHPRQSRKLTGSEITDDDFIVNYDVKYLKGRDGIDEE